MAKRQNSHYILTGRITNRDGEPLEGLVVRAYDEDAPETPLGREAVTDEEGRYTIEFSSKEDSRDDEEDEDELEVFIRVYEREKMLGKSGVRRHTEHHIRVDLQLEHVKEDPREPWRRVYGMVRN